MLVLPVKAGRRYPPAMSRHPDSHIAETNEIVAELEAAGLVTVTQREDGEPVYTLTPAGEQVANQMAMSDENGAAALLDALLEGRSSGP